MLHRFATYEEAALFVAKKRSDGYYAEVLHDNSSTFWGPLAMTGVSAWVSEEAAEEEDEVPELEVKGPELPKELSMTVMLMTLAVPALILVLLLFSFLRHAVHYPMEAGALLAALAVGVILVALAIFVLGAVACFASRWLHSIWDKADRFHTQAAILHVLLAILIILLTTEVGSWIFWGIIYLFCDPYAYGPYYY